MKRTALPWRWFSWGALLILAACLRATPGPQISTAGAPTASSPAHLAALPTVTPVLSLLRQEPPPQAALPLRPTLTFVFNRPLDAASARQAFAFTDAQGHPLPGDLTFPAATTLRFTPHQALQPQRTYRAAFSTSLHAADGAPLDAPLEFTYLTEAALAVSRVYPSEESEKVPVNAEITVVFNKPVVPLTSREAAAPLPLSITPSLPGQGTWVSSNIFTFRPSKPLQSHTTYTVRLPARVRAFTGEALTQGYTWSFTTAAPRVERVLVDQHQALDKFVNYVRRDAALQIFFTQPMDQASVEQALTLTAQDGTAPPITLRWNPDSTLLTLTPQDLYAPATTYTLSLATTARAQDGGRLDPPLTVRFQTAGTPAVLSTSPPHLAYYSPWVQVEFNTYLDAPSLAGHIRTEPSLEHLTWEVHGRFLRLGPLAPGTTYTITLLPGIADLYGARLAEPYTFRVTTAHLEPSAELLIPGSLPSLVRADGPQTLWLRYANLDAVEVSLYAVEDQDLLARTAAYEACSPSGQPLFTQRLDLTTAPRDQSQVLPLRLPTLNGGAPLAPGAYCLHVAPTPAPSYYQADAWVLVVTDHITLKMAPQGALAWVTDLATASPQPNLPLRLYAKKTDEPVRPIAQGTTDAQGLAQWTDLPSTPRFALLHTADRFALVDGAWGNEAPSPYLPTYWWVSSEEGRTTQAFLYTDRPLYRPGQPIFFKGLVRQNQDLHYRLPHLTQVWVILSREGTEVARQRLSLSALGTFHGAFSLADDAPVGGYTLKVYAEPQAQTPPLGYGWVRVAAYHKPVFEVRLSPESPDLAPGEQTTVHLQATYYAGDAVSHAQVTWRIDAAPYTFAPPEEYRDFVFSGTPSWPWAMSSPEQGTLPEFQTHQGTTDAQGRLDIPLAATDPAFQEPNRDLRLRVWASVTDQGGNSADGHAQVLVRQSQVYVGLKTEGWLGTVGDPLAVHLAVLDPQGHPLAQHSVTVRVLREVWHSVQRRDANGILRWESTLETQPVTTLGPVTSDPRGLAEVEFTPPTSGTYRLVARTTDAQGRPREAVLRVWVTGPEALLWKQESHQLPLIPDQPAYRPGDTAHLLVPRPYAQPTYALVTLERGQVYRAQVVRLEQSNNLLDLPLPGHLAPVAYASVLTLRPAGEDQPPDYRLGVVRLPIARDAQRLVVTVTPDRDTAGPGETIHLRVETRTAEGKPVGAEVSLAVVDKALLALAPDTYHLLEALYPERSLLVATALGLVADQEAYNARIRRLLPQGGGMGSGGGTKGADLGGVLTVRESFRDTAYWNAQVLTDPATGRAEVAVPLPDNLTTWVVRARALTQDTRVGEATAEVTVTRPFFVRLHTPAFFTAGDQVTLQAVLHNTTASPLEATVRLTQARGLTLRTSAEQTVTVPAQGQATVAWQAQVPLSSRRVDLTVAAQAGAYRDAARPWRTTLPDGGLPVYAFHLTEAVGTAGVLTQAAQALEGVRLPPQAQQASLRVEVAGSVLAGLGEMLPAQGEAPSPRSPNLRCPYTLAHRLLSHAALLQAYAALDRHPPESLGHQAARSLQGLLATQNPDGGWGWCPEGPSNPDVSALAAWALAEAQEAGLPVDAGPRQRAATYLEEALAAEPAERPSAAADDLAALSLAALARLGNAPTQAAYALAQRAERQHTLSLAGWALLLEAATRMGMQEAFTTPIVQRLENAVVLSATGAHWDGARQGWWGFATDPATTALILRALLSADPQAPFLARAARWLMIHRGPQGWGSDPSTTAALLALSAWAQSTGEIHPDYDFQVLLNHTLQAQGHMDAENALQPRSWTWEADSLDRQGPNTLAIGRGPGPGALYYTAYLDLVLPAEGLPPRADGIAVSRAYYALEDLQTPRTAFRPGQIVQVRLTLTAPHNLHHVVLIDPLPAGLEALNPALGQGPPEEEGFTPRDYLRFGWGGWYFGHREVYDERVVFVAEELPAGVYTLTYTLRAGVLGRFQVRPAVAYEADFPDVGGRSAGAVVEVTR